MKRSVRSLTAATMLAALGTTGMTGCASLNNTERGAVIGAGTGGAIGAAIGRNNGSTAAGAILGAVVGGAAGAAIGRQMDRQAAEIDENVEGAEVERVGEGIKVTFDSGILFPYDSDAVLPAGRENLRELAGTLQRYPESSVLIVGHTDSTGDESYNYALSERRARGAADYLISQGIEPSRVRTTGRGEAEPVASNATEAGRQENRRVEVAIFASPEYREQIQQQY